MADCNDPAQRDESTPHSKAETWVTISRQYPLIINSIYGPHGVLWSALHLEDIVSMLPCNFSGLGLV